MWNVKVQLGFVGRIVVVRNVEERWGEKLVTRIEQRFAQAIPNAAGSSKSNIYYCREILSVVQRCFSNFPLQLVEYLKSFEHHCLIMEVSVTHYGVAPFYAADGENAGAVVCCSPYKVRP